MLKEKMKSKMKEREFILEGKKVIDILQADYIDRKTIYEFIKKLGVKTYGTILDFGCGEKPYEILFNSDKYIGVDIKESGHDDSDKHEDYYYDGKQLPFQDNTFDFIISTQVFEHVQYLDIVIKELYRVLKPNGKIIITVPMAEEEHEIPYDFRRFTQYGIIEFMVQNGFDIISSGKLNNFKYSMKILKIAQKSAKQRYSPSVFNKLNMWIYVIFANLSRLLFNDNIVTDNEIFSNKVWIECKK